MLYTYFLFHFLGKTMKMVAILFLLAAANFALNVKSIPISLDLPYNKDPTNDQLAADIAAYFTSPTLSDEKEARIGKCLVWEQTKCVRRKVFGMWHKTRPNRGK